MGQASKKTGLKKVLCLVGIVTGVIFTITGIKNGFYDPSLSLVSFGADFYTEIYKAQYMTYLGAISIVHVVADMVAAFGIFEICFFGMKYNELLEESRVKIADEPDKSDNSN